jgi:hypothetical protein
MATKKFNFIGYVSRYANQDGSRTMFLLVGEHDGVVIEADERWVRTPGDDKNTDWIPGPYIKCSAKRNSQANSIGLRVIMKKEFCNFDEEEQDPLADMTPEQRKKVLAAYSARTGEVKKTRKAARS